MSGTNLPEVEIYEKEDGKCPFTDWLGGLKDLEARARIGLRVNRLRRGNFGDCHPVGNVSELRIDFGPGYRVYFGQLGTTLALLLCGGTKRRQNADIERAKAYWADYLKRAKEARDEEVDEKL